MRRFTWLALTLLLCAVLPARAWLQNACSPLVVQALAEAEKNCSELGRNTACYGFNQLSATFQSDVAEDFFTKPADRADVLTLDQISTAALDAALQQWGVALLSLQANVPNSLPGQAVRFILFGDAQATNIVPAAEARLPVTPQSITVLVNANLRSQPSTKANVIGGALAGATLSAEGLSADGAWVRVVTSDNKVGWLNRQLIDAAADFSGLPVVTNTSYAPMQAFQLRTGIGKLGCDAAPSLLLIQGPKQVQVEINVNGLTVNLGSTIILHTDRENRRLELITLDGSAKAGRVQVTGGYAAYADLAADGQAGALYGLHPLTQAQLTDLQWLEQVPAGLLEYPISVPDRAIIQPTRVPPSGGGNTSPVPTADASLPVDCSDFRQLEPFGLVENGTVRFAWRPANGMTIYRLTIAGQTTISTAALDAFVDLSLLNGASFDWQVEAMYFERVACTTGWAHIDVNKVLGPMSANWSCTGAGQLTINYANLPPGTNAVQFYLNGNITPESGHTIINPSASGSMTFSTGYGQIRDGSVIAYPSETQVDLPGSLECLVVG